MSAARLRVGPLTIVALAPLVPALAAAQAPVRAPVQGQGRPQGAPAEKPPSSTWRFQLSAEGAWYENPYFLGAPAGTEWSLNGRASLGREQRFRTGTFTLAGFGGTLYYPQADELNQPAYGGSFQLNWTASRNTKLRLGLGYEHSNTRNFTQLATDVPLPTSQLDSANSTFDLEHRLSRRWQLGVGGSFTYRRYDDELLTDGDDIEGRVQLGNQVSKYGLAHLGYIYTSSIIGEERLRSHQVLVGGTRQPERGVGFEIAGGAGYVESTAEFYPAGRFGLSAKGRHATFAVLYYRSFGQAYGYGRQMIGDIAAAKLTWEPTRPLTFNAGYNFSYRRDPADEEYTITAWNALAGFDWKIGGGVAFGARYGWERNETEGFPVIEGARATAVLTYGVDWK